MNRPLLISAGFLIIGLPQVISAQFTTCYYCNQQNNVHCPKPRIFNSTPCGSEDWNSPSFYGCKDFTLDTWNCVHGQSNIHTRETVRPMWNCDIASDAAGAICQE